MSAVRTFIAIETSEDTRARAAELCDLLRTSGMRITWTQPANMHLTLKFLGDTDESRVPLVCSSVAAAIAQTPAFSLQFVGAGAFPEVRRPQTLWVRAEAGQDAVCAVAALIDQSLHQAGFPLEQRAFKPHLTIGRVRSGGRAQQSALSQLLADSSRYDCGVTAVRDVIVLSSHLSPSGPSYELLGRAPLAD